MYDMMQNKLPAPYELNPGPLPSFDTNSPPMYSAMKRGGGAKSRGFATVHMNPHEISIMEHLQGGNSRYNRNGIKEFHHLEELLKNPHILQSAHHHARSHHASGGPTHEEIEHLREGGRFGDSNLAAIGPHTQNFFNQLAGHPTQNPYTGHPEYWSIGKALGGMWRVLKGAPGKILPHVKDFARETLPAVMPAAQQYLGSKFGGVGEAAGQALGTAATRALGPQEGPSNPYHQALGQAIGRGVESYRGGASPSQAFGHGMETAGSRLGGGMGSALEGAGRSMGAGRGLGESLRTGAQTGFNTMGGRQGISDMASQVAQGFGTGGMGGARTAARHQFNDYRNRALPQLPPPANEDYPEYPSQQFVG